MTLQHKLLPFLVFFLSSFSWAGGLEEERDPWETRTSRTYTAPQLTGQLEIDANRILIQTLEGSSNEFLSHVIQTHQTLVQLPLLGYKRPEII